MYQTCSFFKSAVFAVELLGVGFRYLSTNRFEPYVHLVNLAGTVHELCFCAVSKTIVSKLTNLYCIIQKQSSELLER
jgi:hypothetical protein